MLKILKTILAKEPQILKRSYSDTENRLRELQNSFVYKAEIDMGYYTYTAKSDGYVAMEQNCYVGLCSLSDENQTSLDLIMDVDSFMAPHKHDKNDEFLFVIHGEVIETISNKKYTMGQSISIPRGIMHGWSSKDGCKMKVTFKPKME